MISIISTVITTVAFMVAINEYSKYMMVESYTKTMKIMEAFRRA